MDLRWHLDLTADEGLAAHATAFLGAGSIAIGRLCPECGSSGHGAPWLRHEGRLVPVSLSRSAGHLVTVIAERPVGVDIESVAAVASRWVPGVVLAAGEVAHSPDEQALLWVSKEALLKARGIGVSVSMSSAPVLGAEIERIDTPPGLVGAVAFA
jgi:4'-phosphopantetheinyl transferase